MAAIRILMCCVVLAVISGVLSCNEREVEVCDEKYGPMIQHAYVTAENTTTYEPVCKLLEDWQMCVTPVWVNCTMATKKPFHDNHMKLKEEPSSCKLSSGACSIAASLGAIILMLMYTLVLRE